MPRARKYFSLEEKNAEKRRRYATDPAYRQTCIDRSVGYNKTIQGKFSKAAYRASDQGRLYQRDHNLRSHYGITAAEWDAMFSAQSQRCLVCKAISPGSKRGWHTHHTGSKKNGSFKLHGILCHSCNHALTNKMTPSLLRKLASFMESYNE